MLVCARSPPIGLAHRRHLHWQVADCSARGDHTGRGSGTVRPRPATHVAVAARNRISASVARPRVAGAGNRFRSSIGLARGGNPRLGARDPAHARDRCGGRSGRPHASPLLRRSRQAIANRSRGAARHNLSAHPCLGPYQRPADQAAAIAYVGPPEVDNSTVRVWKPAFKRACVPRVAPADMVSRSRA